MKDVIVALDFPSAEQTLAFLDAFGEEKPFVKIGMELFYSSGPDVVRRIKDRGHKIFLDLKLHDIPNTVCRAMAVLAALGVDMTNVHAGGGTPMMQAAINGLAQGGGKRPLLIAVTQLTSTDSLVLKRDLLIDRPLEEVVTAYAKNAAAAGLDGVVCSPIEAGKVHAEVGKNFLTVTPGVRFAGSAADDQARVTTPAKARELGSDFIVMGRPITCAKDPVAAYMKAREEFLGK